MKEKSGTLSVKIEQPKVGEHLLYLQIRQRNYLLLLAFRLHSFVSAKSDKSAQNIFEVCSRLLLPLFYKLECIILSFIVTIHHDI